MYNDFIGNETKSNIFYKKQGGKSNETFYEHVSRAGHDGGTEIILGAPMEFNGENIAEWAEIF